MTSNGRGLRAAAAAFGAVAAIEGIRGVAQGAGQVIDGGPVSANVDSEYRFYSAWYAVVGALLLGSVGRPHDRTRLMRAAASGSVVAAIGRVLSWRKLGPPHPLQRALMATEFALPAIVVWHERVARATSEVDADD